MKTKFRKKPMVIDAIQLGRSPFALDDALKFIGSTKPYPVLDSATESHAIIIPLLGGSELRVAVGGWIVRDSQGEISVCTTASFESAYEPVEAGDE